MTANKHILDFSIQHGSWHRLSTRLYAGANPEYIIRRDQWVKSKKGVPWVRVHTPGGK